MTRGGIINILRREEKKLPAAASSQLRRCAMPHMKERVTRRRLPLVSGILHSSSPVKWLKLETATKSPAQDAAGTQLPQTPGYMGDHRDPYAALLRIMVSPAHIHYYG